MRLTALYAAQNGESFLVGLRTREANNPQFAFLKPFHSMFPTFEKLLDVYKRILEKPDDVVDELEALASDRGLIIKRLTHKWQWEEHLERERKRAEGVRFPTHHIALPHAACFHLNFCHSGQRRNCLFEFYLVQRFSPPKALVVNSFMTLRVVGQAKISLC